MQAARRLLATVTTASAASPARYLTPGNPTGLTGLLTHPSPRSTLIYIYAATLSQASVLPPSSAYRASVEALTRHRLSIVESVKPAGYEEWRTRATKLVEDHPGQLGELARDAPKELLPEFVEARIWERQPAAMFGREPPEDEWGGEAFHEMKEGAFEDERYQKLVQENTVPMGMQGPSYEEKPQEVQVKNMPKPNFEKIDWEGAPSLEARQIGELEEKLAAGLVEEVIQVARGEYGLVKTMAESRAWEELEHKAPPGQWEYFAREQHTPGHEEPGKKS